MVRENQKRRLILCAALLLAAMPLSAQHASGQTDSLVRLLNARSLEQVETDGRMARKAIEPTFLHNGTYLSCDTALWHVDEKLINCFGNVQLMQGESVLTSGTLDYLIDENLAQFRGGVVELRNQRDNVLRTRNLDYNTQDSLAVFQGGAAMISSDGQIIESDEGTYANNRGTFFFVGNVNMFADSVFVRTENLLYNSREERADFLSDIDFWKDGRMLSAGAGWYERDDDIFFFQHHVHGLGASEESWSDSLYYYRRPNDILMLGSVQVQDQSRKVAAMGDRLEYVDSLSRVTLDRRASAALWDGEGEHPDTTYLGAGRFIYWTQPRYAVDSLEVKLAQKRREEMLDDPIAAYRRRAAQEAAQKREEALRDDPLAQGRAAALQRQGLNNSEAASLASAPYSSGGEPPEPPASLRSDADSLSFPDSLRHPRPDRGSLTASDSLAVRDSLEVADSLAVPPPPDTTKIGFLLALKDIRVFRKDMQVRCDSLRYSDLDSIARLYVNPIVWNEERRQYNSDSLFVLLRNDKMDRANLLSNAFIHTEEEGGYFDQIKSTDVIAYFSDSTSLRRFDALGGVTALLYLEENDAIATVNKTESKMMMATFDAEGNVDHVYNYDNPKSDAYPVVQLPPAEHKLRGFNWQPELRPKDKFDVTAMVVLDSEREAYEAHPHAEFRQTEIYFPGHMKEVYAALDAAGAKRNARPEEDSPTVPEPVEGQSALPDSLSTLDTPTVPELVEGQSALPDSLSTLDTPTVPELVEGPATDSDTTKMAVRDSSSVAPRDTTYMSDRELKQALRIARRDARWAALDQRDADKAAARVARREARKARREAREAARQARQAAIDEARLQKYIERYQKQKARYEGRKQEPVPAGERPPGAETGGELPATAESE